MSSGRKKGRRCLFMVAVCPWVNASLNSSTFTINQICLRRFKLAEHYPHQASSLRTAVLSFLYSPSSDGWGITSQTLVGAHHLASFGMLQMIRNIRSLFTNLSITSESVRNNCQNKDIQAPFDVPLYRVQSDYGRYPRFEARRLAAVHSVFYDT